ncbi:MAG: molybdate ABC transporter substrate-binding protein [Acidobacteriaceae bacterium]|jgi:molybdate transport system substrate-binding protein
MTPSRPTRLALTFAILLGLAASSPTRSNAQSSPPREVHVLAAADLQSVLPSLAAAFEHATGIKLIPTFGSSATLATQVLNGDPADLFLSADFSYPEQIIAASLADTASPIPYARGTLVLFARKDSPLQPLTQNTLSDPRVQSIAIADPMHAPYGVAAQRALFSMKLEDKLKSHIVIAENVAQAAQFVESGNAQLGFISLTLASSEHMQQIGSFIRMQPGTYPPLNQCAVVMKSSAHRADAHAFLDWLRSPPIQRNLAALGLDPIQ